MLLRFGLAPRRIGMGGAAFQAYWKDTHAPVVRGMPGLALYHQNHAVLRDGEPLLPWPGFDACAQFGAADGAAFDQAFSSPHYLGPVSTDARQFVDTSLGGIVQCTQRLRQGDTGAALGGRAVRLLSFLRLAPLVPLPALEAALATLADPARARGRELFIAVPTGQRVSLFEAVEVLGFDDADAALAHVLGGEARHRNQSLTGLVRGTERLIAQVVTVV